MNGLVFNGASRRPKSFFHAILAVVASSLFGANCSWAQDAGNPTSGVPVQSDAAQSPATGPELGQVTFSSADEAVKAFVEALRVRDMKRLKAVFGQYASDIVIDVDDVELQAHHQFIVDYDAHHRLVAEGENTIHLEIGWRGWTLPVPLRRTGGKWYFNGPEGWNEIVARHIGANEIAAMHVCLAIVDAENDYVARTAGGPNLPVYALRLVSHPGKHDGLFWQSAGDEPTSPIGPLLARAADPLDSPSASHARIPYHGYFYRLLARQGSHAPGGALEYVVGGQPVGGFAVLAYPAEYGVSGVSTFMVGHDGAVYSKNFGPDTVRTAKTIVSFDPDATWQHEVPDPQTPAVNAVRDQ